MTNAAPPAPKVPPEAVRIHEFKTESGADTVDLGRKLAHLLVAPQLLILRGDLGTGTVSYTHLDVYKRQLQCCPQHNCAA